MYLVADAHFLLEKISDLEKFNSKYKGHVVFNRSPENTPWHTVSQHSSPIEKSATARMLVKSLLLQGCYVQSWPRICQTVSQVYEKIIDKMSNGQPNLVTVAPFEVLKAVQIDVSIEIRSHLLSQRYTVA